MKDIFNRHPWEVEEVGVILLVGILLYLIFIIKAYKPLIYNKCPECGSKMENGFTFNALTSYRCCLDRSHYDTDIDCFSAALIYIIIRPLIKIDIKKINIKIINIVKIIIRND